MNNPFNLTQEILNKWDESKEKPIIPHKILEKDIGLYFINLSDLEL